MAGILAEGRPQEGWVVLGIGINVAVRPGDLPEDVRATATGLGLDPGDVPAVLARVLTELEAVLALPREALLHAWSARDALRSQPVRWAGGTGIAEGVDADGRLRVQTDAGMVALDAGEVHLRRWSSAAGGGANAGAL